MAPIASNPIMWGRSIQLLRYLEHQDPYIIQNLETEEDVARSLVPILVTRELVAPLENDPIMSGRLIWSFRHLEHQNPSIISDSIDSARCGKIFSSNFGHQRVSGATCKLSYHVGEINMVI